MDYLEETNEKKYDYMVMDVEKPQFMDRISGIRRMLVWESADSK